MEVLIEIFPFAFGVLLGLTCDRLGGLRQRLPLWAGASVLLGAFATLASGEWRDSVLYFLFDIALVAVVSAGSALGIAYLRRRLARH